MPRPTFLAACDVGIGVFAARRFKKGERILAFRGRPIDRQDPIHRTPEGSNLLQVGADRYVYPRPNGLFVNHSCNPNAGMRGAVTLVALRNIARGEEIRFDYSTTMDENFWTMPCRCGDPCCRQIIQDFRLLPPELQQQYVAMRIVPDFILRNSPYLILPHIRKRPNRMPKKAGLGLKTPSLTNRTSSIE